MNKGAEFDTLKNRKPVKLVEQKKSMGKFGSLEDEFSTPIEGFHDAVRTPYALRPGRHVGFFWNNKICFNFVSILFEKIKLTVSERTYIIVPMV